MFSLIPRSHRGKHEGENMDYIEKLENLDRHIADNPKDYTAVISRLKIQSRAIDHYRKQEVNKRLKQVAEIRRKLDAEHTIE